MVNVIADFGINRLSSTGSSQQE